MKYLHYMAAITGAPRAQDIHYMLLGISAVLCLMAGLICYVLLLTGRKLQREKSNRSIYERLEDSFRSRDSVYIRLELWLKSVGAEYSVKGFSDPFRFLVMNGLLALGSFLVFGILGGAGRGIMVAGVLLLTELFMLEVIDRKDNREMLDDISFLYDATAIQLSGNIYVLQAISNCLEYIQSKRLKNALTELSANLALGGDVRAATKDFSEKFRNTYLDAFCGVIVQIATETGEAGKLIEDMSKQLMVLKETTFTREKKAAENRLQLCIIGIFLVFTALIFYLCIKSMTGSAGMFL